MRHFLLLLPVLALAGCKPPPTDADIAASEAAAPVSPSEPIDSPETEGAIWADSQEAGRILYGIPGEPPLMALACGEANGQPSIRLTRYALADRGAQAFAALIGNGHVSRIPVDATEVEGASIWQGDIPASDPKLEVLTGSREVGVTIPGAGRLVLNRSSRPGELIEACRAAAEPDAEASEDAAPAQ